jgi:hypothetical protein
MDIKVNKVLLWISLLLPCLLTSNTLAEGKIVYPLQKISALECRFQKFSELSDACKIDLPILTTKDYKKYLKEDGGYNIYTRIYTVLWASSYKYGWDVWNGGHQWVDIATAEWTPVYSIADGKVIVAENVIGWGNVVSVEHEIKGKTVVSDYAHLSKIDVKEWDTVSAGEKIWEVGNTGNSFWNHLHFQIDLQSKFHPYYYDWNECPYSYSKITESDVCTSILEKHTIDPLLFLETAGWILNDIEIKTEKITIAGSKSETPRKTITDKDFDVFELAVYHDSPKQHIQKVQNILQDLRIYEWGLTWDYADIEWKILEFQLSRKIISSASDTWAGYWGPRTRATVKKEYDIYRNASTSTKLASQESTVTSSTPTEKIDRAQFLMTREQIEAKEINDFIDRYDISIQFRDVGWNIKVGESKVLDVNITDRRGRGFRWNTPWELNFIVDRDLVEVFPNKLFYFTDGKRDIKVKWLKSGNTTLYVRIGEKTIKQFNINVYGQETKISPTSWKFALSPRSIVAEDKTGTFTFRDAAAKDIINLRYSGRYILSSTGDTKFCLKKWAIKDIKKIYSRSCREEDYKDSLVFTYEDTVAWILVFDYRVFDEKAQFEITGSKTKKVFATSTLSTSNPKGLKKDYPYYTEVLSMLQNKIAWGIKKWFFQQDSIMTELEANRWIENTLLTMKDRSYSENLKKQIDTNISLLKEETPSKFTHMTRSDFLEKAYNYLVFDQKAEVSIDYVDLDGEQEKKANMVFDKETTWRDQFGKMYYRPEKTITRGEAAFFIASLLNRNESITLTSAR